MNETYETHIQTLKIKADPTGEAGAAPHSDLAALRQAEILVGDDSFNVQICGAFVLSDVLPLITV